MKTTSASHDALQMAQGNSRTPGPIDPRYKRVLLTNITLSGFMTNMQESIILISLPAIFNGIHINPLSPNAAMYFLWILIGYRAVLALLLVTFERIGALFGHVRLYKLGFAIFTVGSILLWLTPSTGNTGALELILFRFIQGIGSSFLLANTMPIINGALPVNERGLALGIPPITTLLGVIIGLILGGILAYVDWRLVFFVSVPLGIVGTIWAYIMLREVVTNGGNHTMDRADTIPLIGGATLLLLGITSGIEPYNGSVGWDNPLAIGAVTIGVILLAVFIWIEFHVENTLFQLNLFKIRIFTAGNVSNFLASLTRGGLQFLLIIWLQGIWLPLHGYTYKVIPLWAGIYMCPLLVGFVLAPFGGYLFNRSRMHLSATVGALIQMVSFLLLTVLPIYANTIWLVILILLLGLGQGMFNLPNVLLIMNSVPRERFGAASVMRATFQDLGFLISIGGFFGIITAGLAAGLPSTLFNELTQAGVPTAVAQNSSHLPPLAALFAVFLGYNPMVSLLPPSVLQALPPMNRDHLLGSMFFPNLISPLFTASLSSAFYLAAALCFLAAIASLLCRERSIHERGVHESSGSVEQELHIARGNSILQTALTHLAIVIENVPDEEAQQRYMHVCIVKQKDQIFLPKMTSLETGKTYDLRLDISPFLDESVLQTVSHLPSTTHGYWLEVIVISDDVGIPLHRHPLFLPKLGPSWVCNCSPGKEHHCRENERRPYLFVPIQTPAQPRIARVRIALYYQKNLLQSQLLSAQIAEREQAGAGQSSIIDYTLASDLRDLSFLPPRTVNILTNDTADGSHRLVINGQGADPLAFHLTEGQIRTTVDAAREALRNVHFEEYGGALGSQRQRRNRLDGNNAKVKAAFLRDLEHLAPLGWQLWTLLLKDRLEWRKNLLAPATIQVARTLSSTLAFPWALVYDIPLASQGPYHICPLFDTWNERQSFTDLSQCPYEHLHQTKNTLCPFGFWGFRHVIEQPPSMSAGRNLPVLIHMTNRPPTLVAGLSQSLDQNLTAKHLQTMKEQLTLFTLQDHTSLQEMVMALAAPVEVVYFYCHGGRESLVGTSQHTPYLQVGMDERFQPSDITTWRVADWPEQHWEQTSPLVFINGCHTAELTPELLANFVDAFSTASAAGVIGTEISIEQDIAAEAAEHFFAAFQAGKTVGQALQHMRLHLLAKGNLLGLAYTPYCSANLHL
ncbi:MFS transporter [Reticulibacter mediterranei]|nr:MFS transporter [Reticulibacter mediterranei]